MNKKIIIIIIGLLAITSFIWIPAIVFAITDNYDKYAYYLKALEYGLEGLKAYFEFIKDMFKLALQL